MENHELISQGKVYSVPFFQTQTGRRGQKSKEKQTPATTVGFQGAVTSAVLQCPFYSREGGQGDGPPFFHTYQKFSQFMISMLQREEISAKLYSAITVEQEDFCRVHCLYLHNDQSQSEPSKFGKDTLPLASPYNLYIQSFTHTYLSINLIHQVNHPTTHLLYCDGIVTESHFLYFNFLPWLDGNGKLRTLPQCFSEKHFQDRPRPILTITYLIKTPQASFAQRAGRN